MFISSFRLRDYKSYLDSGELKFSQGINLVVGQNDVGKSALLEGLGLQFINNPNRNFSRKLTANQEREQESTAEVRFTIERDELWDILKSIPGQFYVPLPEEHVLLENYDPQRSEFKDLISKYRVELRPETRVVDCARICILTLLDRSECTFRACYKKKERPLFMHVSSSISMHGWDIPDFPALLDYGVGGVKDKRLYAACHINGSGELIIDDEDKFLDQLGTKRNDPFPIVRAPQLIEGREDSFDFGLSVISILHKRLYPFHAQRIVQGKCRQEYFTALAPDASNLASFLANIQQETPALFEEINVNLRAILPQIYQVATRNLPPDYLPSEQGHGAYQEILVYQNRSRDKRDAIPLSDCGTGVGQVLAILSIVVALESPCTIIIDEPQSFLHPGAIRKLMGVLRQYPQHQYIISTHSPQLLTTINPSTITLVTKERGKPSAIKSISPSEQTDLTLCLEELGARLSDVFGADQVLWVEGKTEAKCFPLIIEKLLNRPLLGTAIVHVDSTGELEGKDAERVIKIYERLSEGGGLVPSTLGFIFDRENRTDAKIGELIKRLGGDRIRFLGRTMIENYFLNADALAEVMLKLDGFTELGVSSTKVKEWLDEKLARKQDKRYYPHNNDSKQRPDIEIIHGGHILEDLFAHFSEKRVGYDKPRHGLMLTEWLIGHQPEALSEVRSLLADALTINHKE